VRTPLILLALVVAAACGGAPSGPASASRAAPAIQVFTEPSAVAGVVPVGGVVYVATSQGLDRWETHAGKRTRLGTAEGLTGTALRALTLDRRGRLWFATETGIGALDLETGRARMLPRPPPSLAHALAGLRFLAVDPRGGVWIGAEAGLFHAGDGGFSPTPLRKEVTALHAQPDGLLFIGAPGGLLERSVAGVFSPSADGSTLRVVHAITEGPDGAPVALGEDAEGQTRIAVYGDGGFSTFRLSDGVRLHEAARRERGTVLAGGGRLVALHASGRRVAGAGPERLALLHVAGKQRRPPYAAAFLDFDAPPDVTALAAAGDAVYLGTRTLGTTAVFFSEGGGTVKQLRPRELVAGARGLTVACRVPDECYLATGGTTAWRYDGRSFANMAIGTRPIIVLAVVRSPQGEVLALYREPSESRVHVARLARGGFEPVGAIQVETPSGAAILSFAEFAPDGLLWLGLQYVDSDGDVRPHGVATVDLTLGVVTYHHEGEHGRRAGVLPVPNDVVDIAFRGDETWFASGSGAARLRGESVRVWTEADALKSEILRGIVATEGGVVFIASASGVGQFDGQRWSYPPELAIVASSLTRGLDGRLWIGTERGLISYDGKSTRRFDRAAGLLDDRIFDVAVDFSGRIWARGPEGVSLVVP
jgi:hypothetical protein